MASLFQNRGVPRRARGRAYGQTLLAGGVLMFSVSQRGKRTPQDKGATVFIPLEYDICGDITLHTPSAGDSV